MVDAWRRMGKRTRRERPIQLVTTMAKTRLAIWKRSM